MKQTSSGVAKPQMVAVIVSVVVSVMVAQAAPEDDKRGRDKGKLRSAMACSCYCMGATTC